MQYVFWIRGEEHAELARLSVASIRTREPMAPVFVYTDEPDKTPRIVGTERMVLPSGRPAMVANLDAQIAHLMDAPSHTKVLFLDADTLVRQEFPFSASDLYATWRHRVSAASDGGDIAGLMPYNYGVLGALVSPQILETFIWMRARILQMASRYQNWYGNQLALAELLGAAPAAGIERREFNIRWSPDDRGTPMMASLLPCDQYNYSPEGVDEDVSDKVILHMKGQRKSLMAAYAQS